MAISSDATKPAPDEIGPDIPQVLVATADVLLVGVIFLALSISLPSLTLGRPWLPLVLITPLAVPTPVFVIMYGRHLPYRVARGLALALLAVLTLTLICSVVLLVLNIRTFPKGLALLQPAALLWANNVLVFAVWYWEIDGGGPLRRHRRPRHAWDFAFPQHQLDGQTRWLPGFVDYLFLAFNTSTALSPTDTYPLRQRVKLLMMAQSVISLLIIVLLVGRSVNIL